MKQTTIQAGFSRMEITPAVPVGLRGYGNDNRRLHERVRDPLYITCIALRQGDDTALLFTIDTCVITAGALDDVVFEATGIPAEKQFYGATHCHNAPNYSSYVQGSQEALEILRRQAAAAAKAALEDLSVAAVSHSTKQIEKMNFVRHYVLDTGAVADTELSKYPKDAFVGYPVAADKTMVVLKFAREGKKDIALVNWGAHPDHSGMLDPEKPRLENFTSVSADFPGALRKKLMEDSGMEVAFFTGASGNTTPFTRIEADKTGLSMTQYGEKLAEHALGMLKNLQPAQGDEFATYREIVDINIDHTKDHLLKQAEEVYALFQQTDLTVSRPLAKSYGMQSAYEARAIMNRASMDATLEMGHGFLRIGNIGFINTSYEMFSDIGNFLRENNPFDVTFLINGNNSYMCSDYAFDFGSYEAVTCWYERGTAEKLAKLYIEKLQQLK